MLSPMTQPPSATQTLCTECERCDESTEAGVKLEQSGGVTVTAVGSVNVV